MVYESFHLRRFNIVMAILCGLLSILGFCVNGVIPTASTRDHGAYPLAGWLMVATCFAVAAIFLRRAFDPRPLIRIDRHGIWARSWSDATVPWDQITRAHRVRVKNQVTLGFDLKDPAAWPARNPLHRLASRLNRATGFGTMTVNVTYMTGGPAPLIAAIRHFRPDLFD
jgi:hypothetical protein